MRGIKSATILLLFGQKAGVISVEHFYCFLYKTLYLSLENDVFEFSMLVIFLGALEPCR
jgi:hypothetical protein